MDHLALPITDIPNATFSSIPYICNKTFTYDDLGMLTYPQRVGVDDSRLREHGYTDDELQVLGPFLQSWLWFGLLGEALGVGSRIDREQRITSRTSFVVESGHGRPLLNTSELHKFIKQASEKGHAPMFQLFYSERLACCIEKTTRTVERLCDILLEAPAPTFDNDASHPLIEICFSIQLLVATLLRHATKLVLEPHLLLSRTSAPHMFPGTRIVDCLLLRAGWPLCQISQLPSDILLRYYISYFRPPSQLLLHRRCNEKECFLDKMKEIGTPRHTIPNCDCKLVETPKERLMETISNNQIALTKFSLSGAGHGGPQILLKAAGDVEEYVAISHVRSSGLGNNLSNSLPTCQLGRIQRLVNTLGTGGPNSAFFWIDTICVPMERPARKRALSHAREIFEHASKVLVLEPWLSCHDPQNAQEALLRIKYSPWTRRLWTIQEAALAKNLYFDFKNGPHSLEALLSEFRATPNEEQVLPWPKHFEHSVENLTTMLAQFDIDIKTASKMLAENHIDRDKLRAMLRLGYLSFPRIRLFAEESELLESEVVIQALEKVYGDLEMQTDPESSDPLLFKDKLLERLQNMGATDLSRAGIEGWDYEDND